MSTLLDDPRPLEDIASIGAAGDGGAQPDPDAPGGGATRGDDEGARVQPLPALRVSLAVAPTVAAGGVVVGRIFAGWQPVAYAVVAGVLGIAVAQVAARRRTTAAFHATIVGGIIGIGLVLLLPRGGDALLHVSAEIRSARHSRGLLRPPAEWLAGFQVIVCWLMAIVGFAAGWVASELRRPALGLLVPLPLVVLAAISVPESAKLGVGIAVLVLFLVALIVLSSLQGILAGDSSPPSLGYELRRAARSVPVIGVIVGLLVVLARTNLLFPPPVYDPVHKAQRPKPVPLSQADLKKKLFTVESKATGPWRIGMLDTIVDDEWSLPPYSQSKLARVPRSGVVDDSHQAGAVATVTLDQLGGAVLPGLTSLVSINATGPKLAFDPRTGTLRLAEGQLHKGLQYTVTAAQLPTEQQLGRTQTPVPAELVPFTSAPAAPPDIQALIAQAPKTTPWATLQFLRVKLLTTVTAAGPGIPVAVPPERVSDLLFGSKKGSPFEIVAAQALLARWAGIPARIGYGYDGGQVISPDTRLVTPREGASWLEIDIEPFGWFPVTGAPLHAQASLDPNAVTSASSAAPSDKIGVQVFIPLRDRLPSLLFEKLRRIFALLAGVLLLATAVRVATPVVMKRWRRARARARAMRAGPAARVEVAYAELRDYCTDLGLGGRSAPPIAFLAQVVPDAEHVELAWLVTRCLFGDLRDQVSDDEALAAEELSRSLVRRLAAAQQPSLRFLTAVSRLSLKDPYIPRERARRAPRLLTRRGRDAQPAAA